MRITIRQDPARRETIYRLVIDEASWITAPRWILKLKGVLGLTIFVLRELWLQFNRRLQ